MRITQKRHKSHIGSMIEGASDSTECPVCGISYRENLKMGKSVEHVLPKSKYHQYIFSPINLVYFCESCNNSKDNRVPELIFHPLFANINCQGAINITFDNSNRLFVDVSISEPNTDYRFLINELYKISITYQKYMFKVINWEISSMEQILKPRLVGLSENEKISKIKDYITREHHFNPVRFNKTNIERLLLVEVRNAIKQQSEIFAEYILNKLPTLKGC